MRARTPLIAVGAALTLIFAVAIPVTGFAQSPEPPVTVQQLALAEPQTVTVGDSVAPTPLARGTYSATTPEEISAKRAAREEQKRRAAEAARVRAQSSYPQVAVLAAGTGEVRYPLPSGSYRVSRTVTATHNGADMAAAEGTPIYAVGGGVVRASADSIGGYGNAVIIDHVIGGKRVSTLYGHMVYGSRLPNVGERVQAGQLIGRVGNTGRSYGAHLHLEVRVNGSLVEPIGWLAANAR